jgi:hypothetical protein
MSISHEPKQASLEEATAGRFPPAAGELLPQKEGAVDPRRRREYSHLHPLYFCFLSLWFELSLKT